MAKTNFKGTDQLICTFVLAYAKRRFSHDQANIILILLTCNSGGKIQTWLGSLADCTDPVVPLAVWNVIVTSWKHFRTKEIPGLHLTYSKSGEKLGLLLK